jgi:hypothetical protein
MTILKFCFFSFVVIIYNTIMTAKQEATIATSAIPNITNESNSTMSAIDPLEANIVKSLLNIFKKQEMPIFEKIETKKSQDDNSTVFQCTFRSSSKGGADLSPKEDKHLDLAGIIKRKDLNRYYIGGAIYAKSDGHRWIDLKPKSISRTVPEVEKVTLKAVNLPFEHVIGPEGEKIKTPKYDPTLFIAEVKLRKPTT